MWSVSAFMSGKRAFVLTRPSASSTVRGSGDWRVAILWLWSTKGAPSIRTRIRGGGFDMALRSPALLPVLSSVAAAAAGGEARFMTTPDIRGDRVVFAWEGDLYPTSVEEGTPTRLTPRVGSTLTPGGTASRRRRASR